jgi:hypothetical protein
MFEIRKPAVDHSDQDFDVYAFITMNDEVAETDHFSAHDLYPVIWPDCIIGGDTRQAKGCYFSPLFAIYNIEAFNNSFDNLEF